MIHYESLHKTSTEERHSKELPELHVDEYTVRIDLRQTGIVRQADIRTDRQADTNTVATSYPHTV